MKKLITLFSALLVAASLPAQISWTIFAAKEFAGGSGTEEDPYLISTPNQLAKIAKDCDNGNDWLDTYFLLTDDIDLSGYSWEPIGGTSSFDETTFWGHIDGGGHSLFNMNVTKDGTAGYFTAGFVSQLEAEGSIRRLTIASGSVTGYASVGAFAAICSGVIEDCTNHASVVATASMSGYAGGIAGYLRQSLLGGDSNQRITRCVNYGSVSASNVNGMVAGGIVASAYLNSTIEQCANLGAVNAGNATAGGIVGIVASTGVKITDCYNTADLLTGTLLQTGGIVGMVGGGGVGLTLFSYIKSFRYDIALSIILILSFSVLIQWVHLALNPLQPWAPDVFYSSPDNLCEIDKSFANEVASRPYVTRAFGRMYQSLPAEYQGKSGQIDLISYDSQQFQWAEEALIAGDISAAVDGLGVLTVYDKSNSLQPSDTIRLEQAELTVVGVLEDSPFDTSDSPTVICSEELFGKVTGQNAYAILDVQLSENATEQDVFELQAMAEGQYGFYNRLSQNRDTQNTYYMFCLFVYGFLVVITLITVIHTVNSISMSVSSRARQYGAMRAVGMAASQVRRMIVTEAATYTLLGLFAGCGLGLPLHYFLYSRMITNYWGTAWQLPAPFIAGILALLLFTALFAPYAPAKRICNMAVSETINEL